MSRYAGTVLSKLSYITSRASAAPVYSGSSADDCEESSPVGTTCPRNLTSLFPDGVPWSALALITEDMLDEPELKDRGDDGEWRPSRRRRR